MKPALLVPCLAALGCFLAHPVTAATPKSVVTTHPETHAKVTQKAIATRRIDIVDGNGVIRMTRNKGGRKEHETGGTP